MKTKLDKIKELDQLVSASSGLSRMPYLADKDLHGFLSDSFWLGDDHPTVEKHVKIIRKQLDLMHKELKEELNEILK